MTTIPDDHITQIEIFAPRETPDDRRSFIAVTRRESGETIFHPEKGGFNYRMPETQFDELFVAVTRERYIELSNVWMPLRVTTDGETYSDGWSNGHLWNGFECPVFTREAVEAGMTPDGPFGMQPEYNQFSWNDRVGSFVVVESDNGDLEDDFDYTPYIERLAKGETVDLDARGIHIAPARRQVIATADGLLTVFAMDDGWTWSSDNGHAANAEMESAGPSPR